MRRNLIIVSFATIGCAVLYNPSREIRFPAYFPCVSLAFIWDMAILLHQLVLERPYTPLASRIKSLRNKSKIMQSKNIQKNRPTIQTSFPPIVYTGPVPQNFLDFYNNNEKRARDMYIKSLEWRRKYDVDNILTNPQTHFHEILRLYPHAIHGKSRDGCVVLYEILGRAKPRDFEEVGITVEDLVWHFNLRNEFVFQKIMTADNNITPPDKKSKKRRGQRGKSSEFGQVMTIVDIEGVSFRDFTMDVAGFLKQSSEVIDSFYPGRVKRIVIVNVPGWFSSAWSVITRFLPETVKKKIAFVSSVDGLDEYISRSQRPREYGGTDGTLGQSKEHKEFLQLAEQWKVLHPDIEIDKIPNKKTTGNITKRSKKPTDSSSESEDSDDDNSNSKLINSNSKRNVSSSKTESKSGGVFSWMSGIMRSKKAPTMAYLGEKNAFRYDPVKGTWVQDQPSQSDEDKATNTFADSDSEVDKSKAVTKISNVISETNELEEHAILLAIHAAHAAQQSNKSSAVGLDGLIDLPDIKPSNNMIGSHEGINASPEQLIVNNTSKLSADVFLVVLCIYVVSALCQAMLLTLLPVWMTLPRAIGGLGYNVIDLGLVVSAAAMTLLLLDSYCRERLVFILRSSPLRMIRISCGVMVITCLLIPSLLTPTSSTPTALLPGAYVSKLFTWNNNINNDSEALIVKTKQNNKKKSSKLHDQIDELLELKAPIDSIDSIDIARRLVDVENDEKAILNEIDKDNKRKDSELKNDNKDNDKRTNIEIPQYNATPKDGILYLPNPCFILAALVCGAYLTRKASTVLMQVVIAPAFTGPKGVVRGISTTIDVLCPAFCCLSYRLVYDHCLHHLKEHNELLANPLNASCFISIALCLSSLLYVSTLLLNIQFVGDFGVIPDHIHTHRVIANQINDNDMELHSYSSSGHSNQEEEPTDVNFISAIYSIGLQDLQLLISLPKYGYGTKLYNLKVDIKDL
eukprot:gene17725-23317_t